MSVTKITDDNITNLSASKLIGSLPAGMQADTTSLEQSISTLALHMAVSDNKSSFNLPDSFIDHFEDTNGIASNTDATEDNEAYLTMSPLSYHVNDANTMMLIQSKNAANGSNTFVDYSSNSLATTYVGNATHATDKSKFASSSSSIKIQDGEIRVGYLNGQYSDWNNSHSALHLDNEWTVEYWVWSNPSGLNHGRRCVSIHDNWNPNKTFAMRPANSIAGGQCYLDFAAGAAYGGNTTEKIAVGDWVHVATVKESTYCRNYINGVQENTFAYPSGVFPRASWTIGADGKVGGERLYNPTWMDDIRVSNINRYPSGTNFSSSLSGLASATGTLESIASTSADTVSSTCGVVLYEDTAGTATLGTDLIVSFSADNGSNWTPASSYGSPVTFAGSVKVVKVGKTTISNTGTQVKIKVDWANQADGSKVTKLHGWAVNY